MIYILNSAVLTAFGEYEFREVTAEAVTNMLRNSDFVSAVGHQPTATILSQVLGMEIPHNRIQISMQPGDQAIVFRLQNRLPENSHLTVQAAKELLYELGFLIRKS